MKRGRGAQAAYLRKQIYVSVKSHSVPDKGPERRRIRLLAQGAAPSSPLEPGPRQRGYLSPRREAADRSSSSSSSSPLGELGRDAGESGEQLEGLRGSSEPAEAGGLRGAALPLLPPLLMPAGGT